MSRPADPPRRGARARRSLGVALGAAVASLAAASPGATPLSAQTASEAELQGALDDARAAQRGFERLRRRWSPTRLGPWLGSACDETIGRICLRYDEGGDWWPTDEDPRIVLARHELLAALEAAARLRPADDWILGQRVRYLGEAGAWEDAATLARACAVGRPAPCGTLLGFALHGQGRWEEAEAAFRSAVAALDGPERDRWTDPGPVLDSRSREALEDAGPDGLGPGRARWERLWTLADPLWMVPGNDRLTEHWARVAAAGFHEGAANAYAMAWGDDLAEVLIRFGQEIGWDRVADPMGGPTDGLVGHHHPQSRSYVPPGRVLASDPALDPADWTLSPPRPREGYAPPYAPVILPAEAELLRFPRARGMALVATYRLPEDTSHHASHAHPPFEPPGPLRSRSREAGLFVLDEQGGVRGVRGEAGEEGVLLLEGASAPAVASVEVLDPARGFAGRLRLPVEPLRAVPGAPALSDLALLEGPVPDGARLADALPRLRGPGALRPGEEVVVGWEIAAGDAGAGLLTHRLTLERTERSLLQRVGDLLGLSEAEEPLRLSWEEPPPPPGARLFRSVVLDLSRLEPGRHLLRLEVTAGAGGAVVRERPIELPGG